MNGRDQFDIGSRNAHADFDTGLAAAHGGADSRNYTIQDVLTHVTGGGAHTFKTGFTWNRPMVRPQRIGANDNGTFTFRHNLPYNPADPFTYPSQFSIVMGEHPGRLRRRLVQWVRAGPVEGDAELSR